MSAQHTSNAHRAARASHHHAELVEAAHVPHAGSTGASGKKALSDTDQAKLLAEPLHTPAEIRSYLKPAEGLERVAPKVVAFLAAHPEITQALKLDPASITSELADAQALDGPTLAAFQLYRRGYENAMARRSDVARALFKVNRFVSNTGDAELAREMEELSKWVSETHAHGPSAAEPAPAPAATK